MSIDELVGKPAARGADLLVGLLRRAAGAQPTVEFGDVLTTQVVERGGKASMRLKQRRRHEAKMRRRACRRKGAPKGPPKGVVEPASAADLKFLHHLQQILLGTSNRKAALES